MSTQAGFPSFHIGAAQSYSHFTQFVFVPYYADVNIKNRLKKKFYVTNFALFLNNNNNF